MSKPSELHRFWIRFENLEPYHSITLGCGVTAYNFEDAVLLLGRHVFAGRNIPAISSVIEDIDVRMLDKGHVLPNMGVVALRGIWFPKGYGSPIL